MNEENPFLKLNPLHLEPQLFQSENGGPSIDQLDELAKNAPFISLDEIEAGYGGQSILHGVSLRASRGSSLCLIGPNGAGKSTLLHSIYGLTTIKKGKIAINGIDVTHLKPNEKLKKTGVAYILQENSIFPNMTVKENLWMGGYLLGSRHEVESSIERIFNKYYILKERSKKLASALSGGERRLLEISRALMMDPQVLLVDEPSIGLEPRFIDKVFDILKELQLEEGKTILLVEQNAKKGLEFADIGYLLVNGKSSARRQKRRASQAKRGRTTFSWWIRVS